MEAVMAKQGRINVTLFALVLVSLVLNGFLLYYHFNYRGIWETQTEAQQLAMVRYNTQVRIIDSIDTATRLKLSRSADSLWFVIQGLANDRKARKHIPQ